MDASAALSHRLASPDDDEFLFRLYAGTRAAEITAWGWPPAQQEGFLRMQFRARSQSYALSYQGAAHLILVCEEVPVGASIVWRSPSEVRLVDIAFLPEYRHRGWGTQWIARLIGEAEDAGIPLRLSVERGNRAMQLYERLGFVPAGADPMYIEMEHKVIGTE